MFKTFPIEEIQKQLSKHTPSNYNKFFWWRRFGTHKFLDNKAPLLDRIQNGDFEPSPYYWQIQYSENEINEYQKNFGDYQMFLEKSKMERIRRRRLIEDYERDEKERMDNFKKSFLKEFHLNKEVLENEIEEFDGTIEEFYHYCNKKYCKKL